MHSPIKPASADLQARSINSAEDIVATTFKQRDQWSRKIARDPRVKLMHRHVLRSLALCTRIVDGRLVIEPTYAELAQAARCGRSTAIRAVDVAENIGIVRKLRHSDGRVSNAFELLLPATKNAGSNGVKLSVPTVSNLADPAEVNGVTADTVLRLKRKEVVVSKKNKKERGAAAARSADDDRDSVAARTADDAAQSPAFTTSDAATAPPSTQTMNQRTPDGALIETTAEQQRPCGASGLEIGAPTVAGAATGGDRTWRRYRAEPQMPPPPEFQFAKVKRFYPPGLIGDEAEAFAAFNLAMASGVKLFDLIYATINIEAAARNGENCPLLINFLRSHSSPPVAPNADATMMTVAA